MFLLFLLFIVFTCLDVVVVGCTHRPCCFCCCCYCPSLLCGNLVKLLGGLLVELLEGIYLLRETHIYTLLTLHTVHTHIRKSTPRGYPLQRGRLLQKLSTPEGTPREVRRRCSHRSCSCGRRRTCSNSRHGGDTVPGRFVNTRVGSLVESLVDPSPPYPVRYVCAKL